jgi:hypothetical protein
MDKKKPRKDHVDWNVEILGHIAVADLRGVRTKKTAKERSEDKCIKLAWMF